MSEVVPVQSIGSAGCERAPIGLLAELTHRCPLQCPYCSNPLALEGVGGELATTEWQDVLRQAARLGVLQLHLSGGEPTVRRDLEEIVATAAQAGLYTNLITAGVLLTRARLEELAARGLDHLQLSIQDVAPGNADRIARYEGAHAKKRTLAAWVGDLGLPLTINAPVHRQNLDRLPDIIDFAVETGAGRLEVAHIQYYGWALANRAAPEHLVVEDDGLARLVRAAGSVFVGPWTAQVAGDYAIGSNHVLPTAGAARARGGLHVTDLIRTVSVQRLTGGGLKRLAPTITALARAEGLEAHARSIEVRTKWT